MKIHRPYRKYNSTRGPHCPCGTTSPRAADLPGSKALDRGGRLGFGLSPASIRAFLVAQMVKDLPAIRETQVQSMGGEYPLEKGIATHSSILAGESHGQRSFVHGVAESDTTEQGSQRVTRRKLAAYPNMVLLGPCPPARLWVCVWHWLALKWWVQVLSVPAD